MIIENIYLFQSKLLKYFDLKIYLDISQKTALQRATSRKRDLELYGSKEGIEKKYRTKNFAGFELFNQIEKPTTLADIVIDNNDWKNPMIKTEK